MSEIPRSDAGDRNTNQVEAFDLADVMSDFEKQMAALRERSQPVRTLIDATASASSPTERNLEHR